MDRRMFLGTSLAAGLSGLPLLAQAPWSGAAAQAPRPPARIGWLTAQRRESLEAYLEETRAGLADFGYVDGRNLQIEYRFANDDLSKVPALADDLAASGVALMITQGAAVSILAARPVPIPLVFITSGDPVATGLAKSLARPRPGMTGITFMAAEMNGKRLEILRDFLPGMKRIAFIANPDHPGARIEVTSAREKGEALGFQMDLYETKSSAELDAAFAGITARPVDAISVFADGFALQNRVRIIQFATARKVPVVSGWAAFAQSGALFSYGPRLSSSYRRLGYFAHRILTGSRPEDLPIEQPASFELVVNLDAAKALGISISGSVMARADSIIEG